MYAKIIRIVLTLFVIVELCHSLESPSIEPKIVQTTNGGTSERGQFTYQVSVKGMMGFYHSCSGALISDRWVLTSATCLSFGGFFYTLTLTFGGFDVREGYSYLCDYYKIHEHFRMDKFENDIALLRTERPILFNQYVQPIPYYKGNDNGDSEECETNDSVVIGWGMNSGTNDQKLLYARMRLLTNAGCQAIWKESYYPTLIPSTAMCTSYNETLSTESPLCDRESGLPLATMGSRVLFAILSGPHYGSCDNSNQPSLFTRTSDLAKWIFSNTNVDGVNTL